MRIGSAILVIWLLIGLLAAYQRDYFDDEPNCRKIGTTALAVVAGPLNYVGLNPRIKDCDLPEPSR